jgi:hypothetical protein
MGSGRRKPLAAWTSARDPFGRSRFAKNILALSQRLRTSMRMKFVPLPFVLSATLVITSGVPASAAPLTFEESIAVFSAAEGLHSVLWRIGHQNAPNTGAVQWGGSMTPSQAELSVTPY